MQKITQKSRWNIEKMFKIDWKYEDNRLNSAKFVQKSRKYVEN